MVSEHGIEMIGRFLRKHTKIASVRGQLLSRPMNPVVPQELMQFVIRLAYSTADQLIVVSLNQLTFILVSKVVSKVVKKVA